jgi:hypothetical protein
MGQITSKVPHRVPTAVSTSPLPKSTFLFQSAAEQRSQQPASTVEQFVSLKRVKPTHRQDYIEMDQEILKKVLKGFGTVVTSVDTRQPTHPGSPGAAQIIVPQIIRFEQMAANKESGPRPLPKSRSSQDMVFVQKQWKTSTADLGSGRLTESQLVAFFNARRDEKKDADELAKMFNIDRGVVATLLSNYSSPILDLDKKTEVLFGTWNNKFKIPGSH